MQRKTRMMQLPPNMTSFNVGNAWNKHNNEKNKMRKCQSLRVKPNMSIVARKGKHLEKNKVKNLNN